MTPYCIQNHSNPITKGSNHITSGVDSALNYNMKQHLCPIGATAQENVVAPSQPHMVLLPLRPIQIYILGTLTASTTYHSQREPK